MRLQKGRGDFGLAKEEVEKFDVGMVLDVPLKGKKDADNERHQVDLGLPVDVDGAGGKGDKKDEAGEKEEESEPDISVDYDAPVKEEKKEDVQDDKMKQVLNQMEKKLEELVQKGTQKKKFEGYHAKVNAVRGTLDHRLNKMSDQDHHDPNAQQHAGLLSRVQEGAPLDRREQAEYDVFAAKMSAKDIETEKTKNKQQNNVVSELEWIHEDNRVEYIKDRIKENIMERLKK